MADVHACAILKTSLINVLWAIAVDTRLIAAVIAGEDPSIFVTIEGLKRAGAAIHADHAGFGLLVVPD